MQIKVAVIGPPDLVDLVMEVAKDYPDLKLMSAVYNQLEETFALVEQFEDKADIFLFSGLLPYHLARKRGCALPMVYIPYTGAGLYRVLFQLMREEEDWGKTPRLNLSIDILNEMEVRERMAELDFSLGDLYVQEYRSDQTSEDFCRIHCQLWREKKIDVVITCVTSIYEILHARGVPCFRIIPPRSAMRESLSRVQLEGRSLKLREAQLVIGLIGIGVSTDKGQTSGYMTQRKRLEVQQLLLDLGEKSRKLIYKSDGDRIMFVTTRGVIEDITERFTRFSLFDGLRDRLHSPVNMGIGIGYTAGEAEGNARQALEKAEAVKTGSCYAVLQNGAVMGPIGQPFQLDYCARSDAPELMAAAKEAQLSVGTINKLWSLQKQMDGKSVTASDVANWFDITFRSARRILQKLETGGLAVVAGEEQPINKGRPRRLYKLQLSALSGKSYGNE